MNELDALYEQLKTLYGDINEDLLSGVRSRMSELETSVNDLTSARDDLSRRLSESERNLSDLRGRVTDMLLKRSEAEQENKEILDKDESEEIDDYPRLKLKEGE